MRFILHQLVNLQSLFIFVYSDSPISLIQIVKHSPSLLSILIHRNIIDQVYFHLGINGHNNDLAQIYPLVQTYKSFVFTHIHQQR